MKHNLISKTVLVVASLVTVVSLGTHVSASDTATQINEVNQKISDTQKLVNESQKKLSKLQDQQYSDSVEIASLTKNINARKSHLAEQARSAQQNDTGSLIEFLTDSKSFSDAIDRVATVATMIHANNQTLQDQKNDQEKVAADKKQVDESVAAQKKTSEKLRNDMADLAVQKIQLKVKKAKEDAAKEKAEAALAAAQKAAAAVKAAKSSADANKALATATKAVATVTTTNTNSGTTTSNTSTNSSNNSNNSSTSSSATVTQTAYSTTSTATASSSSSVDTSSVVAAALSLTKMNIPYVWGGESLSGMDCSGLTAYVYAKFGVSLPHNTVAQEGYVTYESVSQAQPGDLLFWGSKGASYHVAIYIGNGQYVHAPRTGETVRVGSVSGYAPSFAGRLK
ncbi:NlpC/P60 family protein [Liquorilactobacillus mali]|uniref:NlpC P60 n=1 Tax=Liquorilactobacillus mali TaxID=1618 RepID=A0A0R2FU00_9LACO|nr:C40 family peptidase [Liquorilactobacillus mali]KRN28285.1 NlpC P60 [Liquorilactobacillus mali]MDN7146559.1 NlpC/P60 family protein [Liquorilactobacillus mali]